MYLQYLRNNISGHTWHSRLWGLSREQGKLPALMELTLQWGKETTDTGRRKRDRKWAAQAIPRPL